jgi:drug/metabolite transporter (DMT)-like permease
MPPSTLAVLLGLASAASWGAGDFTGGVASKRTHVLCVLVLGQAAGVTLILAMALLLREEPPPRAALAWGMAAGVAGAIGLAALYRGLAEGRMAVVAPVSAVLSAAVPVMWSAGTEGMPPASKLAGFALALAGIWLVAGAGPPGEGRHGLGLAVLAGAGFGAFLVLMDRGAQGGTFWPLAAARGTSLALALAVALARRRAWAPSRSLVGLVLLAGVLDAGGNAFFVLASRAGRLDIAAVLSSMYPASMFFLAAGLPREWLTRPQGAGIVAVLGAIVLIAA